jgi:WXG100 family type VII secretion target
VSTPGEIYIEYGQAEQATQDLLGANGQLENMIDDLQTAVNQWKDSAQGMGADEFDSVFLDWKTKATNAGTAIRNHAGTLSSIIDSYSTTDNLNANRMSQNY